MLTYFYHCKFLYIYIYKSDNNNDNNNNNKKKKSDCLSRNDLLLKIGMNC